MDQVLMEVISGPMKNNKVFGKLFIAFRDKKIHSLGKDKAVNVRLQQIFWYCLYTESFLVNW